MVSSSGSGNKKDLSFDVNVLPVVDVFSVCIIFLLLTTVWIHVGTINVSQAIGGETNENKKNPPSVSINVEENGSVLLKVSDLEGSGRRFNNVRINATEKGIDHEALVNYAMALKQNHPEVETALVLPTAKTSYASIIRVMDQFKKADIRNIGISPL